MDLFLPRVFGAYDLVMGTSSETGRLPCRGNDLVNREQEEVVGENEAICTMGL